MSYVHFGIACQFHISQKNPQVMPAAKSLQTLPHHPCSTCAAMLQPERNLTSGSTRKKTPIQTSGKNRFGLAITRAIMMAPETANPIQPRTPGRNAIQCPNRPGKPKDRNTSAVTKIAGTTVENAIEDSAWCCSQSDSCGRRYDQLSS